jgi:tRNA threonylcarbamoyladenosine biosynthesis protein TsaB
VILLSLDTTSNFASVAIRADGKIAAEVTLESTEGFAHLIFPAIERCKNEAKIELEEIDCFAAAAGPGSFTGVRIGLSSVKGLAEAKGKPAIGISNLRALSSFGKNPKSLRAVVLDARRGEVYAGVYDGALRVVVPESVSPLEPWLAKLDPTGNYELISALPIRFGRTTIIEPPRFLASAVALCAELDGREGKWMDPSVVDANYVRRSDAELFWKDG